MAGEDPPECDQKSDEIETTFATGCVYISFGIYSSHQLTQFQSCHHLLCKRVGYTEVCKPELH
jgi:hypothetical protein